jgi:hypothetical protein
LFREVAEVDVEHGVWISIQPFSVQKYRQMVAGESGFALAVEEEGIRA